MQKTRGSTTGSATDSPTPEIPLATPAVRGDTRPTGVVMCRVSSQHQKQTKSIDAQIEWAAGAVERDGVRLLPIGNGDASRGIPPNSGWIIDDGISGSLLAGRAFKSFIDGVEADTVTPPNRLYAYHLSRIDRENRRSNDKRLRIQSRIDAARIAGVLGAYGVTVIDETGANDPDSMAYDIKRAVGTEEYRGFPSKASDGKARRYRAGCYPRGGRPPYGYALVYANGVDNNDGWIPVVHTEAAKIVRRVLGWYVAGGLSFAAQKANEAGIPTPPARCLRSADAPLTGGRGAEWTKSTVAHIVDDVGIYLSGEQQITWAGKPYRIKYPPIIDGHLHAGVERRKRECAPRQKTKFLSAGFCTCAKCGGRVWVKNGIGRIDAPSYRYIRCDCGSMSAPRFQSALWVMVATRYIQIAAHEKNGGEKNGAAYEADLREARAAVKATQDKLDRLALALANGMDEDTWHNANVLLVREKTAALGQASRIERQRDEAAQQKATVETTEARVAKVLERLKVEGAPDVDGCRKLLADVLVGGRVTVQWADTNGKRGCAPWAALTLPAFGKLPAFTGRTDQIPERILGVAVKRGDRVEVMVQSAPRDLGNRVALYEYTTAPLASVMTGKGALGVPLPPGAPRDGHGSLLVESTDWPAELAGPPPAATKRLGKRVRERGTA